MKLRMTTHACVTLQLVLLAIIATPSVLTVNGDLVKIHSLHVDSLITSRFARNVITSSVSNLANESKEIFFEVELPKSAFISNFSMTIDGKTYVGVVKEKNVAEKVYKKAVSRGQSAGIVRASGRLLERFKVSVTVAAQNKVNFQLIYEELLIRKFGQYQLLLKIQPKQLVEDFQIEVTINETRNISLLDAEGTFLSNELIQKVEKSYSGNTGRVLFKPSLEAQRSCAGCQTTVLDGEFVVKYDVDRSQNVGDIQVINGYFVHFFAPENLPQISKRVVFVIDVSSSMHGQKIIQTREALLKIADDLHPEDYFNLVIFSSDATAWKNTLIKADATNVAEAKQYIRNLYPTGWTNLNAALLHAVGLLMQPNVNQGTLSDGAPMIILLTDGAPTKGVTQPEVIKANVKQAINGRLSLYCLGFGYDLNYNLLQTLALENGGVARRIYEDSDAELQLQGFYNEVAQPLLKGVQVQYPENAVSNLTRNSFEHYFGGSEIVVAGKISSNDLTSLTSEISAKGTQDHLTFNTSGLVTEQQGYIFGEYIERLWAYLTIQQIMEKQVLATGEHKELLKNQTLALSLKYNFVTPLTSMVVTKPEENKAAAEVAEKSSVDKDKDDSSSQVSAQQSTPTQSFVQQRVPPRSFVQQRVPPRSFVDGDPHFIVRPPGSNETICFNVQMNSGIVLNLVEDPITGITINGELIGKYKDGSTDSAGRTYIGRLGLRSHKTGVNMEITPKSIIISSKEHKSVFTWTKTRTETHEGLMLSILEGGRLTVTINEMATFIIVLHHPLKKNSKLTDYLGLYTEDKHLLSKSTRGILGQFYQALPMEISELGNNKTQAMLSVRGIQLKAVGQWRKDFHWSSLHWLDTFCWFVPDKRIWLMDGQEEDYVVSGLYKSPTHTRVRK
ncbi:inter-alpha-trypsin inhibitor heavy chain H3 isoform X2 [Bombina bombina]|uniref:inter-alpha-trypsin inhibitor heavy chain H3 isoform X2 n=1 Tax=Bombina bombina TaxID=8345 RepID=UPI00235AACAC|nr:inter-alpha-trypsin inhibitor heavy chain H3 isoform X2 [Bombina bombina]